MKANGKMGDIKEKGLWFFQMEPNMKDNGEMVNLMVKEFYIL